MKIGWSVIIGGVVCLLVLSCAPTRKIGRDKTLSISEVLKLVRERNDIIQTLKGDGSITVEAPEESKSGSFDIDLKKPDSLKLRFSGPFGINVGTMVLSKDRFLFYNSRENRATVGKPEKQTLRSMFRLDMEFEEVMNAFTGEFPIVTETDSVHRFYVEDESYVIKYTSAQTIKEIRIDGDAFIVTSYRVFDGQGKVILTTYASRIDDVSRVMMPKLLRVVFPQDRRSVTIAYDDLDLNEQVDCSFILPKHADITYR